LSKHLPINRATADAARKGDDPFALASALHAAAFESSDEVRIPRWLYDALVSYISKTADTIALPKGGRHARYSTKHRDEGIDMARYLAVRHETESGNKNPAGRASKALAKTQAAGSKRVMEQSRDRVRRRLSDFTPPR